MVDKSKNDSELPTLRDSTNYLTKGNYILISQILININKYYL
jgi:hypothetical protein